MDDIKGHGNKDAFNSAHRCPSISIGKDVSTFTATSFALDKRTVEWFVTFAGIDMINFTYDEAGERRGRERESVPIDQWINAFSYLGNFLLTFAISMRYRRGIKTLHGSEPFKVMLEEVDNKCGWLILWKREVAVKPAFTRTLVHCSYGDVADWPGGVMSIGTRLWRYATNVSTPREAGKAPLPEFLRTIVKGDT